MAHNLSLIETCSTGHLLVNTSICKVCNTSNTSNHFDTCSRCHFKSNSLPQIISTTQKSEHRIDNTQITEVKEISDEIKFKYYRNF